ARRPDQIDHRGGQDDRTAPRRPAAAGGGPRRRGPGLVRPAARTGHTGRAELDVQVSPRAALRLETEGRSRGNVGVDRRLRPQDQGRQARGNPVRPRDRLLESDVAFPVAKEIVDRLAEDLRGKRISREVSLEQGVEVALRDAITKALSVPPLDFFGLIEKSPRPFVVMFVGVNGTGKTTTIAKLAYHIMKKGYTCVVAAADTFRAGAIEQLEKHAEAVGFKLIKHNAGADPAAVAFDAVEHARARGRDV